MNCPICQYEKSRKAVELLPVMDPLFNIREIVKQLTLLEDHLNHAEKRCPDCVTKHFLTVEALAEECISLKPEEAVAETAEAVATFMRIAQRWWIDKEPERRIAQGLRACRKSCQTHIVAYKVASQHLASKRGEVWAQNYLDELAAFANKVIQYSDGNASEYDLKLQFGGLRVSGRTWANHVVDAISIPPKKAKGIEMVARLFNRPRRPKDVLAWYMKNHKRLNLLVEATDWPVRSKGEGIIIMGSFHVHNTLGLEGKALDEVRDTLAKAESLLRSSKVPRMNSAVYGSVYLVGQIKRKNWAAWYQPKNDGIYYRPGLKVSREVKLQTLIHEIGHRYWKRLAPADLKAAWKQHDGSMRNSLETGRIPEVGEVLPMIINKKTVRVDSHGGGNVRLVEDSTGELVGEASYKQVMGWMADAAQRLKFPTLYAATEAEEHFCEALALYSTGKLKEPHKSAFEKVIK